MISIVLPTYNSEKTIKRSLESILFQSFKDYEIIIIDDGSKDKTVSIIKEFQDKRIKFFYNFINKGLAFTLNKAISLSKYDLIARFDSDDLMLPNRIQKQYEFMIKNKNIDILGTNALLRKEFNQKAYSITNLKLNHNDIVKQDISNLWVIHPSVMIRKNILIDNKYNEQLKRTEDLDLWLRLKRNNYKFANLKEAYIEYTTKSFKRSWYIIFVTIKELIIIFLKYPSSQTFFGLIKMSLSLIKRKVV